MPVTMNMTLYRLLLKTGASEADAEVAARTEIDTANLVTKADLTAAIHELKSSLLMWMIGIVFTAMGIQTALFIFVLSNYGPGR
jgi:hypothetical protein